MRIGKPVLVLLVAFSLALLLAPYASADAVNYDPITSIQSCCSGGPSLDIVNAGSPYLLTAVESGSQLMVIDGQGASFSYLIKNNTSSALTSFTLYFSGTLWNKAIMSCATGLDTHCSVDGSGTSVGPYDTSPYTIPVTLSFSGMNIAAGSEFLVWFQSYDCPDAGYVTGQPIPGISGTSTATSCTLPPIPSVPEPGTLGLLGIGFGLLFIGGAVRRYMPA